MRAIFLIAFFLTIGCSGSKVLPKMTEVNEWVDLFNGNDLAGWTSKIHHYEAGDNYADTFRAEDGIIKVRYDKYEGDFDDKFGHLYTDKSYSSFHLILEYRFIGDIHPGTPSYAIKNSGIMFHSQDPKTMLKEQNWPVSVEMQFLAGINPGEDRPTGNMCSPGTDVIFKGEMDPRHCIPSSSETYYGDQWVKAELIVYEDSLVQHIINGKKVLEYTKPQVGGGVVAGFDPKYKQDGTLLRKGHIALQAEGQPIDFRNILIREL